MGTESVPKMGTESIPKPAEPRHLWVFGRWPKCEPARILRGRPHFWYGFRTHFGYGFRPHFGYGFRPHFWARNQSSRFETRANFEHGNRAQNGDGSGIRYEKFNPNMTKKCGPTRNEKNNNLVINSA